MPAFPLGLREQQLEIKPSHFRVFRHLHYFAWVKSGYGGNFGSKKTQEVMEEFGRRMDSKYFSAKYFGRLSAVASDRVSVITSRILPETFSRMRMKSFDFEDLLNPVKVSTHES